MINQLRLHLLWIQSLKAKYISVDCWDGSVLPDSFFSFLPLKSKYINNRLFSVGVSF